MKKTSLLVALAVILASPAFAQSPATVAVGEAATTMEKVETQKEAIKGAVEAKKEAVKEAVGSTKETIKGAVEAKKEAVKGAITAKKEAVKEKIEAKKETLKEKLESTPGVSVETTATPTK